MNLINEILEILEILYPNLSITICPATNNRFLNLGKAAELIVNNKFVCNIFVRGYKKNTHAGYARWIPCENEEEYEAYIHKAIDAVNHHLQIKQIPIIRRKCVKI